MRRSLLFIPANVPGMLQNADVFEADGVIFDLEDAVNINEKDAARILLTHYLTLFPYEKNMEVIVRINSYDFYDLFIEDLKMLPLNKIDTLMLPKASTSSLKALINFLNKKEKELMIKKEIKIIPIIELAKSLMEIDLIAKEKRVTGLLLGAEDLSADMQFKRTASGEEIFFARSLLVTACRAYKIDAIDTPYTNTENLYGLNTDSTKAKAFGLNAKAAIHPNQIPTINRIFSPTKEEIIYAKKILEKAKIAKEKGLGAFSYQNKMIDKPVILRALDIIKKAKLWNLEVNDNEKE